MGMIEQATADIKRIRTDPAGFTKRMTFTKSDGIMSVMIYGMHAKIHMTTNTMGETINAKRPHVSIAESALTDLGYITRNAANECSLKDDRVTVIDSAGINCQYIITEVFPDEAVGIIVCMLKDIE